VARVVTFGKVDKKYDTWPKKLINFPVYEASSLDISGH
jgi:hypothetical protein